MNHQKDTRTECFAVFASGVIAGQKSGHTRHWPGGNVQIDFYDSRGYQIWIADDRAFDSRAEAESAFAKLYLE